MQFRTDRELLRAHARGEQDAFADIVRKHSPYLLRVAYNYSHNEHDAQDVVQEALLKAYRNLRNYRGEAQLSTWLHRTTVNTAIDHKRRVSRKDREISIDDEDKLGIERNTRLSHDPLRGLASAMALRNEVAKLPRAQRRALLLIDVHDMSVERAAEELGVRPGTVKSRRYRARSVVAEAMMDRI